VEDLIAPANPEHCGDSRQDESTKDSDIEEGDHADGRGLCLRKNDRCWRAEARAREPQGVVPARQLKEVDGAAGAVQLDDSRAVVWIDQFESAAQRVAK